MIFVLETELPDEKLAPHALQYVYGIGKQRANILCKKVGVLRNLKIKNLTKKQLTGLEAVVKELKLVIAGALKKKVSFNNAKLLTIKSYRGLRKERKLPARGQRTHTNAKTSRRPKNYFFL